MKIVFVRMKKLQFFLKTVKTVPGCVEVDDDFTPLKNKNDIDTAQENICRVVRMIIFLEKSD